MATLRPGPQFIGLVCAAAFLATAARDSYAQTVVGLDSSVAMGGEFCTQGPSDGSPGFLYPSTPVSINWRGRTYSFSGSVWQNRTSTHRSAVASALKAARVHEAPPRAVAAAKSLGWAHVWVLTDMRAVANGVLVATDGGEWGGGVSFLRPRSDPVVVVEENTVGLFELNAEIVALTGLAHLTIDRGDVFRIDLSGPAPTAHALVQLPGAPRAWAMAGEGALLVATSARGVAISPDGTVEAAKVSRACIPPASVAE